jgi:sulfate adenylyltransferase
MIEPHGGELVDRVVPDTHAENLQQTVKDGPHIHLDGSRYQEVINIATGRFSPITGFLSRNDFLKVVHDMTLEDGAVWPLPVILDVDAETATELSPSETAGLLAPDGELIGTIDIAEIYKYNGEETAKNVFGTTDRDHPGVANLYDRDDFLVGGPIKLFAEHRYNDHDLLPKESRVLFDHWNWETVVGFQTRNAPHRAHEYIQKSALEHTDGLLVQPKLGNKKEGDYQDDVILGAYEQLMEYYYTDQSIALSVFPSQMRYAGPREAVFDAIVRKNQGCSHFVIGHDHAGVGDYYEGLDAHRIFDEIADIGIQPLFYSYVFFCTHCDNMTSEKLCPHGERKHIYPRGSKIRRAIRNGDGESLSKKIIRPEVRTYVMSNDNPFVGENA